MFTLPAKAADDSKKCRYSMLARLPMQYHGTAMNITVEGKLNDTPAVMLIDTGATDTFLTRLATDKLQIFRSPTLAYVTGIGGRSRLYEAKIRNIAIGPIRSDQRGSLMAIDEMGSRPDMHALVGADFLLQMDLEISLAEKQVRFFSPTNCEKTFLGYWDPAAVEVPMLLGDNEQRPIVEVRVNGVKLRALIDTGATVSSITLKGAGKAGVTLNAPGVKRSGTTTGIGQKTLDLHRATFATFSIGDETINNPILQMHASDLPSFDVILGTDFMRAHRMLFAVSQKKLYLSYIGGQPFSAGDEHANAWVEQEAKAGNSYAQYLLGMGWLSNGDAASNATGMALMDQALASKNYPAMRFMAVHHAAQGRHAQALALYDSLLASDPYDLTAQLEVFVVRHQAGQGELAKPALAKVMEKFRWPPWPAPIVDYYLGKVSLDELLRLASKEDQVAKRRRCEVFTHARSLQAAMGQAEQASALQAKAQPDCGQDN